MSIMGIIVAASLSLIVTQRDSSKDENPGHQVIEVRIAAKELREDLLNAGKFALPQLRIYDRQGRQIGDFGSGYSPETFRDRFEAVLKSAAPTGSDKTLVWEIKRLEDQSGKRLEKLPEAKFTVVVYWAEWCEPCHALDKQLKEILATHKDLTVNVLHVEADPQKAFPSVVIEKQDKKKDKGEKKQP
jgi:thiol-disulfide isomerase/thioredoxin